MKKILLLILITSTFVICGCCGPNTENREKTTVSDRTILSLFTEENEYHNAFVIQEMEYKSHKYLVINGNMIIHNPDCDCQIELRNHIKKDNNNNSSIKWSWEE